MSIDNEIQDLNDELAELIEQMGSIQARLAELATRKQPSSAPLLSVTEAARKVGVSRATLYRMIDNHDVTVVRAGSTMKVPSQWVDAYIRGDVEATVTR